MTNKLASSDRGIGSGQILTFLPSLAVLGSVISVCVGTSNGKSLFALVGAEGTSAMRVGFAAIMLALFWRPWKASIPFSDLKKIALYGVVLGLMNLSFYMSLQTLPLGIAIAIEFIGPMSVAIFSSRRIIDFIWIGFALVGLCLLLPISPYGTKISPIGICYVSAAALFWALYIVFGKRLQDLPAGISTSIGMTVAAMVVIPFGVARAGASLLDPKLLVSGTMLAFFSSAIPFSLEMYALKRMPKNTFGILVSLEPAVGALVGLLILHELLTTVQWLAITFIVVASIGCSITAKTNSQSANTILPSDVPADIL